MDEIDRVAFHLMAQLPPERTMAFDVLCAMAELVDRYFLENRPRIRLVWDSDSNSLKRITEDAS